MENNEKNKPMLVEVDVEEIIVLEETVTPAAVGFICGGNCRGFLCGGTCGY